MESMKFTKDFPNMIFFRCTANNQSYTTCKYNLESIFKTCLDVKLLQSIECTGRGTEIDCMCVCVCVCVCVCKCEWESFEDIKLVINLFILTLAAGTQDYQYDRYMQAILNLVNVFHILRKVVYEIKVPLVTWSYKAIKFVFIELILHITRPIVLSSSESSVSQPFWARGTLIWYKMFDGTPKHKTD